MAAVIAFAGRCTLERRTEGTHFDAILRSIVYQQLSGRAAATIHERVKGLFDSSLPLPEQIIGTAPDRLRAAGLSSQKAAYLRNLALHALDGSLPVESLHTMEDAAIIDALIQVKGIGRWSAQMFLMFRLGRPDVLPDLDLGVQKGMRLAYGLRKLPKPERVLRIGNRWAPFRSIGAWYMWRVLELSQDELRGLRRLAAAN